MNVLVAVEASDASSPHHLEFAGQLARAYGGGVTTFDAAPQPHLAQAVLEAADRQGCDLIVIGTEGLDPFISRFLDSPAHEVLEARRLPVLVVHPGQAGLRKRGRRTVLAAMADAAYSARVLQHALHLAKALGAEVKVVHVGSREEDPVATLLHPADPHPSQVMVAQAAGELGRQGVRVEGLVVPNYAGLAAELAQTADRVDADVIVIGSSGKLDLGQWLMGSIAEAVLHLSRRPVLVVPRGVAEK